jgi:hypothetical protein
MSLIFNRRRFLLGAGVAALALHGCATLEPEDSDRWRDAQREALRSRAQARWDALIKGDIATVYGFTSPEYRAVVSEQQFRGKYGSVVDWRLAEVKNISYDSPTVATVSVEVTYRTWLRGMPDKPVEAKSLIPEKWIYNNREWWYTVN